MRLSIRQLEVIRAVAEHRGVSAAAKALRMAQPAVTRYLSSIEREYGVLLFERTARGTVLTPVGEAVLHRIRVITAEMQGIEHDVQAVGATFAGRLVIGMTAAVSSLVPKTVTKLLAETPGLEIVIREDLNRALLPLLRAGELDVMFAPAPPDEVGEGLDQQVLFYNRLSIVARQNHPLTRKKSVNPAELLQYRWVLPGRNVPARLQLEIAFHQLKMLPPRQVVECDSLRITRELVLCSDCLSVMVKDSARYDIERKILRVLDIDIVLPMRPMAIVTRRMSVPSSALSRFVTLLREEIDRSDDASGAIPLF